MNVKGSLALVVAVLIVVLLSATCIIPIVQEAQELDVSKFNNTSQRFTATTTANTDVTISISEGVITINGNEVQYGQFSFIAVSPKIIVSTGGAGSAVMAIKVGTDSMSVTSMTWSNGNVSYVDDRSDPVIEGTIEDIGTMYYIDTGGKYGIFGSQSTIHIDNDVEGLIVIRDSTTAGAYGTLTYENGVLSQSEFGPYYTQGVTYREATAWNFGATVTDEEGKYSHTITNVTIELTLQDGETKRTHNASMIAPIEYHDVNTNGMLYVMLGIIPLLVFIIPIMLIVRHFNVGRD